MRSKAFGLFCALTLVSVVVAFPDARAYETIRRDSPLGRSLAEIARRTGTPVEILLGPHAWKPAPVVRDSAGLAARRAAAVARLQARLSASTDGAPPILFAAPPILGSMPPRPPGPTLPDSLTSGLLSFAVGDLDGDGLPDLVGVEFADSMLDVRRNLGGGAYAPAVHYQLALGASNLALGDFNGDGYPDVAVVEWSVPPWEWMTRRFSVLLNLGDGTLGARSDNNLPVPPPTYLGDVLPSIFVADFGHDGRDDLVFSRGSAAVEVVLSHGDGTFGPVETLRPADGEASVAAVGDLDGDGNPDIALVYRHGDCFGGRCVELAVFYGRGDRTFEEPATYQGRGSEGFSYPSGLELQDVDGDRRTDILVSVGGNYGPPAPALIRNAGGRRLEAPSLREIARTPSAVAAGRFRTGEPEDLVVSDDATVALLRNRGDGTFAGEVDLARGSLLDVVDLDRDGLSDVITASGDTIEIRLADGSGGFRAPASVTAGRFVATADFTGDHRTDLAVILPNDDIGILAGDGSGGFGAPRDFGPATDLSFPLQAVDLDGDGIADLASARVEWVDGSWFEDSLHVRWGTGSGFTGSSVFDLGWARPCGWPMDLKAGDFNGDGQPDLAVVEGSDGCGDAGVVCMVPGLGHRAFGPPSPPQYAGEDPCAGTVADFDGDGLDDLAVVAVTTDWTGEFSVFRGRPDGTLAEVPPPPPTYDYLVHHWAFSIAAGDFDRDGRTDVAVGCYGGVILAVPNISPILPTTPTLASLVSVDAMPDLVSLLWDLGGARTTVLTIERRAPSSDWVALAVVTADGTGRAHFDDRSVVAGSRYGYRLRLGSGAGSMTTAETWVDVPVSLAFALEPVRPNPARGGPLTVHFTLASASAASLELLDVAGRRISGREVGSLGAGHHALDLGEGRRLAPGLYLVCLRQGASRRVTRVAVLM